jgi:uncharacterized repeat protein (TIGR02543 family)
MNNSANVLDDDDDKLSSSYISKVSQSSVEHNVKQYKVIFIGNINVGKTSIIKRYVTKQFNDKYTPSIGIAYERIKIKVNSTSLVKLNLWDTAGNEKYKSVTKTHFNGADVVLFVYDITDEQSFTELSSWITTVNEMCGEGSYLSYKVIRNTYFTDNGYDAIPIPTREGYKFLGWYKTRTINATSSAFTDFTPILSNLNLYACWEKIDENN